MMRIESVTHDAPDIIAYLTIKNPDYFWDTIEDEDGDVYDPTLIIRLTAENVQTLRKDLNLI